MDAAGYWLSLSHQNRTSWGKGRVKNCTWTILLPRSSVILGQIVGSPYLWFTTARKNICSHVRAHHAEWPTVKCSPVKHRRLLVEIEVVLSNLHADYWLRANMYLLIFAITLNWSIAEFAAKPTNKCRRIPTFIPVHLLIPNYTLFSTIIRIKDMTVVAFRRTSSCPRNFLQSKEITFQTDHLKRP